MSYLLRVHASGDRWAPVSRGVWVIRGRKQVSSIKERLRESSDKFVKLCL